MKIKQNYRVFSLPKDGSSSNEYEDAYSPQRDPISTFRFAIADGATESSYAKIWADLITGAFVNKNQNLHSYLKTPAGIRRWLKPYRDNWRDNVPWEKLTFFSKEKAQEGAYCTFLGLELIQPTRWRAWAIGDCELFQIRDNKLFFHWPVESETEFGSSPDLICSIEPNSGHKESKIQFKEESYRGGTDTFILTTDAMAAWFLSQRNAANKPWEIINRINTDDEFADFVNEQRRNHLIRNDDVTFMYIKTKNSLL